MTNGGERVRVVVTGMGCVSPVGNDAVTTWSALCDGTKRHRSRSTSTNPDPECDFDYVPHTGREVAGRFHVRDIHEQGNCVGFCGLTNVRMLVTPSGPKNWLVDAQPKKRRAPGHRPGWGLSGATRPWHDGHDVAKLEGQPRSVGRERRERRDEHV